MGDHWRSSEIITGGAWIRPCRGGFRENGQQRGPGPHRGRHGLGHVQDQLLRQRIRGRRGQAPARLPRDPSTRHVGEGVSSARSRGGGHGASRTVAQWVARAKGEGLVDIEANEPRCEPIPGVHANVCPHPAFVVHFSTEAKFIPHYVHNYFVQRQIV